MKKMISMVLVLLLLCMAGTAFAEGGGRGGNGGGQGGMRGGNSGTDKSGDAQLQTMIAETAPSSSCLPMRMPKPAPVCSISCIFLKTMMKPSATP